MRADNGGEFWHIVIGAAVNVAVDTACKLVAGEKVTVKGVLKSAAEGAISTAAGGLVGNSKIAHAAMSVASGVWQPSRV